MSKVKIFAGAPPIPKLKGYIRDLRPMWLLEELEVPYEVEYLESREAFLKPEFLAMSPFGKVPAMRNGELTMFESGAICQYLADKYKRLIPSYGTPARLVHDQWYFASIANFEFNALRLFACDNILEPSTETDLKRKNALEMLDAWLPQLNKHLEKVPNLTGDEFQLCDLFLTTILRYLGEKNYLEAYPATPAWIARNISRPAFARAREKNGGPANAT